MVVVVLLRLWATILIAGFVLVGWGLYQQNRYQIDPKYCSHESQCVPVGCECTCSGCGGFSYEDIVNERHVDEWYEKHKCSPPESCLAVCCSPMTIVCEFNTCKVKSG